MTTNTPTLTAAQQLAAMIALVATEHQLDLDKGGMPYFLHGSKVAHILRTGDLELRAIAFGHDLIEDHGKTVTYQRLRELGMSERIIEGIRCMTKLPGESYEEYKAKVRSNIDSIRVKMADLQHNMDLRRLKGVAQEDLFRMNRYIVFYHELELAEKTWAQAGKYIVFAGDEHYPIGGAKDKVHSCNDLQEARTWAKTCKRDWVHVYGVQEEQIVFTRGDPEHWPEENKA